jgi:hypothetical protein
MLYVGLMVDLRFRTGTTELRLQSGSGLIRFQFEFGVNEGAKIWVIKPHF